MASDAVRLGVVGLGGWGKNVVRSFGQAQHCEVACLCDANPKSLEAHSKLHPRARCTDSYESLLGDPSIDAVALATPAPLHFEMARAALEAGKHVYVEKPMTLNTPHAEELVELADKLDRKLMVGHLLEYHPVVDMMKQRIDSGDLGRICYMYCQRLNLGVVRTQENAFWSLAPHDISVILYLFGQEPDGVTARGECYLQDGIEDVVFVNLHFPDGRMAQIHVSWLDPQKERKMVVVGSEKMMIFDDMQAAEKLRIIQSNARVVTDTVTALQAINIRHGDVILPRVPTVEPLLVEVQHFVDSIRNNTTPRSDGRDGLRVVRILEQVDQQLQSLPKIHRIDERRRKTA